VKDEYKENCSECQKKKLTAGEKLPEPCEMPEDLIAGMYPPEPIDVINIDTTF
jgi:hypothetical protein